MQRLEPGTKKVIIKLLASQARIPRTVCSNLVSLETGQCRSLSGIHGICSTLSFLSAISQRWCRWVRATDCRLILELTTESVSYSRPARIDKEGITSGPRAWQAFWMERQSGVCQILGDCTNTLQLMVSVPHASQLAALQRFPISRDISAAFPNNSEEYLM